MVEIRVVRGAMESGRAPEAVEDLSVTPIIRRTAGDASTSFVNVFFFQIRFVPIYNSPLKVGGGRVFTLLVKIPPEYQHFFKDEK